MQNTPFRPAPLRAGRRPEAVVKPLPERCPCRRTRAEVNCALLVFGLLAVASAAPGQLLSSALVGVVRGPVAQPLSGVRVHLVRDASRVSETTTDGSGRFKFPGLRPGTYALEFEHPGWAMKREGPLELRGASTLELAVDLAGAAAPSLRALALEREVWWGAEFGELALRKLPNARNIWSFLESQDPSAVTDRIDVGGLRTGEPALFGALGASWTENQYRLNGFNLTDAYQPGRPAFHPDPNTIAEYQVVWGAKPASMAASGASLSIITPRPPESFHGAARAFYSGRSLQSDNLEGRLERFNFPGPERVKSLVDGSVELGGNLPPGPVAWPFFVSGSTQRLAKTLGGFASLIEGRVERALAEFTPVSHGPRRLDLFYAGQHVAGSHEGASLRLAPSATTRGNDSFHQAQARWHATAGQATSIEAGFGVAHSILSSGLQPGLGENSAVDLPLGRRTGPAPLGVAGRRTRTEANALAESVRDGPSGSHRVNIGFDWERSGIRNRWDSLTGLDQTLVEGQAAEVTRWNTPAQARGSIQSLAGFAQDAWRPLAWLRLTAGLRLDTASGRAAGAASGIRWTTFEPRAGLVLPLPRRGVVVRASWSRYAHQLQGRYLDFGNPRVLGGDVFRWQDLNGNAQAEPEELGGLVRVFGGPHSALDQGLARPFTDEVSVGLEQSVDVRFLAAVRFFRRDAHRLIALSNPGVPPASYTPVDVLDPGNDSLPSTADDQLLTLYNRDPTARGEDFLLLTNPPGHRASYKGFEIRLVRPFLGRWRFSASFTAMRTLAATNPGNSVLQNDVGVIGSLGSDPNTWIGASSRTFFDRAFIGKATGYYRAPLGLELAMVTKYYDGLPFGRLLFVSGLNQGPLFVRATPRSHPGGFQTEFNLTVDVRVGREFRLGSSTFSGYLDYFNILNINKKTLEGDLTGPTFEWRVPLAVQAPRLARLGLEWRW